MDKMNPHKMNKIDVSQMSEEDQKAFKMFGRLPQKNLLSKMQKDRKYFDSGDYMMSKAGVQSAQAPGTAIPTPEGLPHAFSPTANTSPALAPTGSHADSVSGNAHGSAASAAASPVSSPSPTKHAASGSFSHAQAQAQPIPGGGHHHAGSGSSQDGHPASPFAQSPGVGVGIRPAGEDGGVGVGGSHRRRPSVTMDGARTSPPAPLREGSTPSSSYPIHHATGSFGSSPVKTSLLARRMVDQAVEETD